MKVLLYNPPMPYEGKSHKQTPLGLCYLSSAIRDKVDCVVYDGNVLDDFYEYARDLNPDVIGISILTATYNTVICIAKNLKNILPKTIFIAGGIHASVFPEDVLKSGFDIVIRGEGEVTFREIINLLCDKKIEKEHYKNLLADIDGVSYCNADKFVHTRNRECIDDLDKLAFPDRSNLPLDKYEHDSIMTSRGCAFNCFYCSSSYYWGQKVRYRTAENVFAEILDVVSYGINKIYFCDDNFTSNHRLVKKLCKLIIQSGIEIQWSALTRVDTVNPEILKLMKSAGCEVLSLGIENGTADFMNETKKTNFEKTVAAFQMIKEAQIKTRTTWIVGLGKSYDEERESFNLLKLILPDQVSVHCLIPFPNTDAWNNPEKYNIIIDKSNMNWDIMNMTYSPQLLDYVKFKHISKEQIIDLLCSIKQEMKCYGYNGKDRVFETFIDESIIPVFQED